MLELITGTARRTAAFAEAGRRSQRHSIYGVALASTLTTPRCKTWCLAGSGLCFSGWCGLPLCVLTISIATGGKDPPPERVGLSERSADFVACGLVACERGHTFGVVEAPRGSRLWKRKLRQICEKLHYSNYDYVSCGFGVAYRKPQRPPL